MSCTGVTAILAEAMKTVFVSRPEIRHTAGIVTGPGSRTTRIMKAFARAAALSKRRHNLAHFKSISDSPHVRQKHSNLQANQVTHGPKLIVRQFLGIGNVPVNALLGVHQGTGV